MKDIVKQNITTYTSQVLFDRMSVDPLGDHPKQISISPYTYTVNNPIRYTDPTGMIWEDEEKAEELKENIRAQQRQLQRLDSNH